MLLLLLLIGLQGVVSLGVPKHVLRRSPDSRYDRADPTPAEQTQSQGTWSSPARTKVVTVTLCACDGQLFESSTRSRRSESSGESTLLAAGSTSTEDLTSSTTAASSSQEDSPASTYDPLQSTASVITVDVPSGTAQILVSSAEPSTEGIVQTNLETAGHVSTVPIITSSIPTPTTTISKVSTTPTATQLAATKMLSHDIFAEPIGTDSPPSAISQRKDHPAPRLNIEQTDSPIQTNKFYANFFLGQQEMPAYLFPYAVAWAKGKGGSSSWGLAVSHVEPDQRVYGSDSPDTGAAKYYVNPVGIHSVVLSAKELGADTLLTTDELTAFSARVNLKPSAQSAPAVQFPLVQGSGFVTAVYSGSTPLIQTGVYFKTVTRSTKEVRENVVKYKLHLEDGTTWLLYAYHAKGEPLDLQVVNNGLAQGKSEFHGIVQVAKDPGNGESVYDAAAGAYATGVTLSGGVEGSTGTYKFKFKKDGAESATLVMYSLPHHRSSFDGATKGKLTEVKLATTTKGMAAIVAADEWTMVEGNIPTDIGFLPWQTKAGSVSTVSDEAKSFIHNIAMQELSQNMVSQSNQNSMYFSGKALAKFASIVLAANDILGDTPLAQAGLGQLKIAFARFSENKQPYPLVYESAWGGVVSSATYETGDPGVDFGNTYYNDHHFHYGYFVYAAAVIGHLDPTWVPINKPYVNMLVRDFANPSSKDKYFPVSRSFDWYHGHSWAHGLFDSLDGKNQESSSEDTMAAYAIKMWGQASGDQNMEARGNLMLAVQARSLNDCYLYRSDNTVQPDRFIGNKVAGILFENKVDHTTFFGTNIEYIQGIHMLPLLPHTPYIRKPEFVSEEWERFFSSGRAESVVGGWKGILMGNLATIDPRGAYKFFSSPDFDPSWLDGGASLTWYLCYAAALGGL